MSVSLALPTPGRQRTSTAAAFAWYYWRLNRVPLVVILALSATGGLFMGLVNAGPVARSLFAAALILPFMMMAANFAGIVAPLSASKGSAYPRYLLRLPARTAELAFWPMAYAAPMIAAAAGMAGVLLGPGLPQGWLLAEFAAIAVWLQVVTWASEFPVTLQTGFAVFLLVAIFVGGPIAVASSANTTLILAGYIAVTLIAYPVGLATLRLARTGSDPSQRPSTRTHWLPTALRAAFRRRPADLTRSLTSAEAAQYWVGRYGHSLTLRQAVLLTTLVVVALSVPLMFASVPSTNLEWGSAAGLASIGVPNAWVRIGPLWMVWFPFFLAQLCSGGLNRTDIRKADYTLNSVYATRPLTTASMVAVRLKLMMRGSLMIWASVMPIAAVWAMSPAEDIGRRGPIILLILRHLTPNDVLPIGAGIVLLVYATFKLQSDWLFGELSGCSWVTWLSIIPIAPLISVPWLSITATAYPDTFARLIAMLPATVAIMAIIKTIGMVPAITWSVRLRLYSTRQLIMMAIWWVALAVPICACVVSVGSAIGLPHAVLLGIAFLLMPGPLLALAAPALHWNRHR